MSSKRIWQHKDYPNFIYDKEKLEPLLFNIKHHQELLNGVYKNINTDELSLAKLKILTTEIIDVTMNYELWYKIYSWTVIWMA